MSEVGMRELVAHPDRPALPAATLAECPAAVVVVAFSSVTWIAKTFRCTEAEAAVFKANANNDFDQLMGAVRRARGDIV